MNNRVINIGFNVAQRFRIRTLPEPETIIIILVGTALKVLEEGGL
jgi:hypothetical protein